MQTNKIYSDEELEFFSKIENDIPEKLSQCEFEKEKNLLKQTAINTIEKKTKKRSLNIRLFEDDIEKIKAIAFQEGLPYQTYLSSVIHKLALGQLKVT